MKTLSGIRTATIFCSCICVLITFAVKAQSAPTTSTLVFSINDKGKVTAELDITLPQNEPAESPPPKADGQKKTAPPRGAVGNINQIEEQPTIKNYGLWVVALPVSIDPNSQIKAPNDVRVAILERGQGYTLLVLVTPPTASTVRLKIENIATISETAEGKGKFEFDLSYSLMTEAERNLLTLPNALSSFDIRVLLPEKYQETAIGFTPPYFTTKDYQTFFLPSEKAKQESVGKAWIVFPNPMTSELDKAKLIFSLIVGVLTLFFTVQVTRRRQLSRSIIVFGLSVAVIAIATYFTYALTKRMDFMIFAAAALPHAIYTFFSSIYLFIANKFQATIAGNVTVGGAPSQFVDVKLVKLENGNQIIKKRKDVLKEDGNYMFYVWQGKKPSSYKIVAKSKNTEEKESPILHVARGEAQPVPPINLPYLPPPPAQNPPQPPVQTEEHRP
jgi:hypothetical protein